ncbi:uncharacterized protein LOC105831292 [Monomorium pharaonis]|uniref:uncharacterized protein LOC105831292 n=1 Tax=Monomorium pharaonis TaxID=307658 RepID=UPI00063F1432|nr:uncharacterized protein LOC105831292 [Monomorium pharaonis]
MRYFFLRYSSRVEFARKIVSCIDTRFKFTGGKSRHTRNKLFLDIAGGRFEPYGACAARRRALSRRLSKLTMGDETSIEFSEIISYMCACNGEIWPPRYGNSSSLSDIMIDATREQHIGENNWEQ